MRKAAVFVYDDPDSLMRIMIALDSLDKHAEVYVGFLLEDAIPWLKRRDA